MAAAAGLTREFAATPMPGRTWLQHASPTTFGLKAAGWLDMIGRCRARLDRVRRVAQWCCSWAARPERWHRWAATARPSLMRWRNSWAFACRRCPGTRIGIALLMWRRRSASRVAASARLAAISRCSRSRKSPRPPTRAAEAPRRCRTNRIRFARSPRSRSARSRPGLVATMLSAMPQEHERAAGGWQAEWPTLSDLIARHAAVSRCDRRRTRRSARRCVGDARAPRHSRRRRDG